MKGQEGVRRGIWFIPIFIFAALIYSPKAEAGPGCRLDRGHHYGHGYGRYHKPHSYDYAGILYSSKNFTIAIGGHLCSFCGKRFCRGHHHRERVIIHEPGPIIITSIPYGCRKVRIDGHHYYKYNDTYYIEVAGGYQIVDRPHGRYSEDDRDHDDNNDDYQQRDNRGGENFNVNIPNRKGGYTAVTLKRSGSGYIGPQGEYYSDFPKVEQLRAMYEK